MKKVIIVAIVVITAFAACKKTDSSSGTVVAKWNYNKVRFKEYNTPTTFTDTTIFLVAGSYADFRADGKVYSKTSTTTSSLIKYDTSYYSVSDSNITFISTSGVVNHNIIQTLTGSNMVIYGKTDLGSGYSDESWAYFSK